MSAEASGAPPAALERLDRQIRHMEWADARVWRALLALPDPPPRAHQLLHHLHQVQWIYLRIWHDEAVEIRPHTDYADLRAMLSWARGYYSAAREYLASVAESELARELVVPWQEQLAGRFGRTSPATLEDSILQVVLHSSHHRAQLCTLLREAGGEPPLVDFIAWVWHGAPRADWSPPEQGPAPS